MIRRHFLMSDNQETIPVIKYTTSDGSMFDMLGILNYWLYLSPNLSLGAYIVSNTYDGIGQITLNTIIDRVGYFRDDLLVFPIFNTGAFNSGIDITKLTSVELPDTIIYIGNMTFSFCTGLQSVAIPKQVESIGESAFELCTSLTSITIPNSVKSIGYGAFDSCTSLKNVVIGSGVSSEYSAGTQVGWFYNCPNIESIVVKEGNSRYDSRDNCNAIVETEYNTIRLGCKNTKIVDSIEYVGDDAFEGITMDYLYVGKSIKNVKSWPEVTNIHFEAINAETVASSPLPSALTTCTFGEDVIVLPNLNGTSIVSIQIPPKITYLSYFKDCANLNEIIIPTGVTKVLRLAFLNTNLYKKVYYLGTIEDWCAITFGANTKLLGNLYVNSDQLVENLTIPDTIITIGAYTFQNCPSIKSVVLHNNITTINSKAFSDCINLQTINYEGTMELWGLITLGSSWNLNVPAKVVHCTDGDVTL